MQTRTFPGLGFDPAPGSVADVEAVLTRLAQAAGSADGSAHGLRRAARGGSWQGPAASAFRSGAAGMAGGLDEAVAALRTASRAVTAWQSRLVANQREADALEAQARALCGDPEAADALARVLDRAGRLQARHLRQASAAAAALRSATGSVPDWPSVGTGRHAGVVSGWTGEVAAGLSVPVWPPAGGVGIVPGEEGGFAVPVADLPGTPDLDPVPGRPDPGRLPSDGLDLGGLLPDTELAPGSLPGLPEQAATSPAGWLDTGHAPALRPPLDHLPAHRPLPDATPAGGLAPGAEAPAREMSGGKPVDTGTPVRHEPIVRHEPTVRAERPEPHRPNASPRHVDNTAERAEPHRPNVGRHVENAAEHHDSGDREGAARTSGRGGEEHGPGRFGGHAAPSAPAGGPSGPGGVVDPPAHRGPAGGSPTPTTGAPPPLPAPPIDQTVEQQAAPATHDSGGTRPDPVRAVDTARPDAGRPNAVPDLSRNGPDPSRITPDPGRGPDAGRGADIGRGEPGRGLEPGRTTGADPSTRPASTQNQPGQPAKSHDRDSDPAALFVAPLPNPGTEERQQAKGIRAFLMTRPDARPVLVLIKPGGSGEPLFLTGLTPCASPLPGCAAPLPAPGPTTVY